MQNLAQNDHNIELTQAVMHTLDDWKLSGDQILTVMALPDNVKIRHLSQFRNSIAFPETPEVTERLRHLLGIIDALSTSYPTNPRMSLFWMTRSSKKFQNRTPLQVILDENLDGLITIRKHLDCSYDWFGDKN
jgi:hypothetical protein